MSSTPHSRQRAFAPMSIALPWVAVVPLLVSTSPSVSSAVPGILPRPSLTVHVSTDTGATAEPSPVPLTDEVLTQYVAVQRALNAFWRAHPLLCRAARASAPSYTYSLIIANRFTAGTQTIQVPDVVALAAREPAVAAIFQTHHLPPARFVPLTIAVRKALATEALTRAQGMGEGYEGIVVRTHRQALAGVGVDFEL